MTARVMQGGLFLTVAAVTIQSVAHVVNVAALDHRWNPLNADSDTGGAAWAGSGLQFTAAVLVLLLAARFPSRQRPLVGLAALLAFFSLDDIIAVHERVAKLAETLDLWAGADRLVWPVVYLPLLAAAFLGLWGIADGAGADVRRLIRLGLGLLVVAVSVEVASQALVALDVEQFDAPFVAEVVIEEGAELAGWALVTMGLAASILAVSDTSPSGS